MMSRKSVLAWMFSLSFFLTTVSGEDLSEKKLGAYVEITPQQQLVTSLTCSSGELMANGQVSGERVVALVNDFGAIRPLYFKDGIWGGWPNVDNIAVGIPITDRPNLCPPSYNTMLDISYWQSSVTYQNGDKRSIFSRALPDGTFQALAENIPSGSTQKQFGVYVNRVTGEEFVVWLPGQPTNPSGIFRVNKWTPVSADPRVYEFVHRPEGVGNYVVPPVEAVGPYIVFRQSNQERVAALVRLNRQTGERKILVFGTEAERSVSRIAGFKANEFGEVATLFIQPRKVVLVVFSPTGQAQTVYEAETPSQASGYLYSFSADQTLFSYNGKGLGPDTLVLQRGTETKELIVPGDTVGGDNIAGLGMLGSLDGSVVTVQILKVNGVSALIRGQIPSVIVPEFSVKGIVNAAGTQPISGPIAPGEIISIYGTDLTSEKAASATNLPLPMVLAGTRVNINGMPCPAYYVGPTQINCQVPYGLSEDLAEFEIIRGDGGKSSTTVSVTAVSPALFHFITSELFITHGQTGDSKYFTVVGSGFGEVEPRVPEGHPSSGLSLTVAQVTAVVGGRDATVLYSGLAPGFAGLYQINVLLPVGLGTGKHDAELSVGGSIVKFTIAVP